MDPTSNRMGPIINTITLNTQQFFSDVTTGKIQKPLRPWKPFFRAVPEEFNQIFNSYEGDFDRHIATSIPMYREMQLITGNAIVKAYSGKEASLIDIAGSEGTWAKTITKVACSIATEVLDCNEDMGNRFCEDLVYGCSFTLGEFGRYRPTYKYDIVHAGMAFQFMKYSRGQCIGEVKNNYLLPKGLFLIEEKVVPNHPKDWFQNETLKNEFKRRYYSEEAIKQKQADVVNDMDTNLVRKGELLTALRVHFEFVTQYYDAGNFVGFACSNSVDTINRFGYTTITF